MEHELYSQLNSILHDLARSKKYHASNQFTYQHLTIIRVYLWAVLHDRPTSWATKAVNWRSCLKPKHLPSQPTMSRRMRCSQLQETFEAISHRLGQGKPSKTHKVVDAKPLVICRNSIDPDTPKVGYAYGHMERGYKLYTIFSDQFMPVAWDVRPINQSEVRVTRESLLPQMATDEVGYLLGDTQYDVNPLYQQAGERNLQLVAKRMKQGKALGHRKQSEYRLKGLSILCSELGKQLMNHRVMIEREFAQLIGFGGGLTCLPIWVRRLHRVKMWVWGKLIINALRKMRNAKRTIKNAFDE